MIESMSAQEIFNKVVTHLRNQNRRSVDRNNQCVYLSSDGDQCAIGCLIPKEDYLSTMERKNVTLLFNSFHLFDNLAAHLPLLYDLQCIHDQREVRSWEQEFFTVSHKHNLTIPTNDKEI